MKYIVTPEFHRQLWLNFSPFKLLTVPVILGCIFVFWLLNRDMDYGSEVTGHMLVIAYCLIVFLQGNFAAAYAMPVEVNSHTWDFQRISSQSPVQLAFGKLFGATAYSWYCALSVALFFAVFIAPTQGYPIFSFMSVTLAALLGQGITFLMSMYMSSALVPRAGGRRAASDMMFPFIVGSVVSFYSGLAAVRYMGGYQSRRWEEHLNDGFEVAYHWHGFAFTHYGVAFFSLIFLLGWVWIGCYRTVRTELMYRSRPIVWAVFIPVFLFWYAGFYTTPALQLVACTMLLAQVTFLAMIIEASDIRKYRRLADGYKAGDNLRIFENMPKWIVSLPWLVLVYCAMLAVPTGEMRDADTPYLTAMLLFMIRDGFCIHAIQQQQKHGTVFHLFAYFVFVYVLCPMVAFTLSGEHAPISQVAEGIGSFFSRGFYNSYWHHSSPWLGLFYPGGAATPEGSFLPALLEAAFAGFAFFAVAAAQTGTQKETDS